MNKRNRDVAVTGQQIIFLLALSCKLTRPTKNNMRRGKTKLAFLRDTHNPQAQEEKMSSLVRKFKVQNQADSNDKNCNNGANDPLVPAHSPCHGGQNSLTLSYVFIHSMQLQQNETIR